MEEAFESMDESSYTDNGAESGNEASFLSEESLSSSMFMRVKDGYNLRVRKAKDVGACFPDALDWRKTGKTLFQPADFYNNNNKSVAAIAACKAAVKRDQQASSSKENLNSPKARPEAQQAASKDILTTSQLLSSTQQASTSIENFLPDIGRILTEIDPQVALQEMHS
jgi:hypothetical protein